MVDILIHHLTIEKEEGERKFAPGLNQKTMAQRA
jgi:hypothetical protein